MWQTTESCSQCEKLVIEVKAQQPIRSIHDLPNTYDDRHEKYVWKFHEFFGYALIPVTIEDSRAVIEAFFCFEEDDLDDIDVRGFAGKFFRETVFSAWKNIVILSVSEPILDTPGGLQCRKLRHRVQEEVQ
jgi:hypothetical protein